MNERDLFISHSSGDADMARELRAVLEGAGYTCWMAPDDVIGTTPWAAQILNAIETSRAMLVLVSSHSNQSTHVSREVELAMSRGRAVFPIRVEAVPPSGALEYHIAGLQRIDAFPPPIANHRDRILLRLALAVPLAVPLAGLAASPPTLDAAPLAPTEPQPLPSTQPLPPMPAAVPPMPPPGVPTPPPAVPPPMPPPLQPTQPLPPRGLGAWARANAMLAGSAVTLVALFVVAAIAFALSRPSSSSTPGPGGTVGPAATTTAIASPAATVAMEPTSTPSAIETPIESGGAFPNQAELALFAALPDYGKGLIADCDRDTSGDGVPIGAITCDADNGDLMFYELYADVATQQSEYRDWVEIIMANPTGSCAKADSGDAAWSKAGTARGHLACYVAEDGGADFYWTDEQKLITVYWYGEQGVAPGTTHSIGYQLFLDWTAN